MQWYVYVYLYLHLCLHICIVFILMEKNCIHEYAQVLKQEAEMKSIFVTCIEAMITYRLMKAEKHLVIEPVITYIRIVWIRYWSHSHECIARNTSEARKQCFSD